MNRLEYKEELLLKILKLSDHLWEKRVRNEHIELWLNNFKKSDDLANCEEVHAMFLLSNFMYFGVREIRELLKSVFRDKIKIPLVNELRRDNNGCKDINLLMTLVNIEIESTRFLGMGNPSESGNHLLYFFRQENELDKELFIHAHQIISYRRHGEVITSNFTNSKVKRYVFLDDVCGSGTQAIDYSKTLISEMKKIDPEIEVCYYTLFSTATGLKNIKDHTLFDKVDCIFELDDTFRCFSENSRYFKGSNKTGISREFAEKTCRHYGNSLCGSQHSLGYKNGQMLLGFSHNIPDNTLPVIWSESGGWKSIFKRYQKI